MTDILEIIDDIPDHSRYLTVDELRGSTRRTVEEYADVIKFSVADTSSGGTPIEYIEIGDGDRVVLVYAFAHPDEPVGSLVIDYLVRKLASDNALRRVLNCRWFFISCIDPDGTRLNAYTFACQ